MHQGKLQPQRRVALAPFEYAGFGGTGAFNQSGGTNTVSQDVELGGLTTADSGSYALNGIGYLAANAEFIGYAGSGTFTQSGGTNAVTGIYLINGSGLYNLSAGMLTAATITLGASGTFVQSGGFVSSGVLQNGGTFDYSGGLFNGQLVNNGTVNFGAVLCGWRNCEQRDARSPRRDHGRHQQWRQYT